MPSGSMEDLTPQIAQVTRVREQLVLEGTRVALELLGERGPGMMMPVPPPPP